MLEKTFILDTAQNDENNLFLGYCSSLQYRLQCWSCTTWFLNLFMYHHIASWPSRVAANQSSFCFRLVCVNGKKTNVHPVLTVMFENVLRTFEGENPQIIFKKFSVSPQIRHSYKNKLWSFH